MTLTASLSSCSHVPLVMMVLNKLMSAVSQRGVASSIFKCLHVRWSSPGADVLDVLPSAVHNLCVLIGGKCYNMNRLSHYAMRIRRTAPVYFYFTYLFHFTAHPSLLYDTYANPLPLPCSYLPFAQLP
jgi:hypothetical protein